MGTVLDWEGEKVLMKEVVVIYSVNVLNAIEPCTLKPLHMYIYIYCPQENVLVNLCTLYIPTVSHGWRGLVTRYCPAFPVSLLCDVRLGFPRTIRQTLLFSSIPSLL